MPNQFFLKLSQNFIELLDDGEYYDITIEVGEDHNVKIFRAHMNILCYRSPYLRRVLTSNVNKKNNGLTHIKLPNISPETFQTILEYIYGGILSLNNQDILDIIKILFAADNLRLQELINHLQEHLIKNKSKWVEQHFELIHEKSFQSNSLLDLQQFCTDFMAKFPEEIFRSLDFTSISEKSLIQLIKNDDLQMKEIEVWEHVLKWGLAKNPTLNSDPDTWSDDDFKKMKDTLQNCLPLIRFFNLSSKEFLQKVRPYKKLLKHQLYENLLSTHMSPNNSNNKPNIKNILPPRNIDNNISLSKKFIKIDRDIDSKIINFDTFSALLKHIDFSYIKELNSLYKCELLLRGSRDGFTPKKFHELCDDKPYTITFIKIKGEEEIIGGYNPLEWNSSGGWVKASNDKDNFIFSFKNNIIKDAIISNIENINCAFYCGPTRGPYFGDIAIYASNESANYSPIYCQKLFYEKVIRDNENQFLIDDYEVFQIIKK